MRDVKSGKFIKTHGMKGTRFYRIWERMKQRAGKKRFYENRPLCKRWAKFENFRDDMFVGYKLHVAEFGEKDTTIERINNNLGYNINNCTWATMDEQFANRTFAVYLCTYNGCRNMTRSRWYLCPRHYKYLWSKHGLSGIKAWYAARALGIK